MAQDSESLWSSVVNSIISVGNALANDSSEAYQNRHLTELEIEYVYRQALGKVDIQHPASTTAEDFDPASRAYQYQRVSSEFCEFDKWEVAAATPKFSWAKFPWVFTVRLSTFRKSADGNQVYVVEVRCGTMSHELEKRFSEFYTFWEELYKDGVLKEWNVPPKTWFRWSEEGFLEERRKGLEQCLVAVLRVPGVPLRPFVRDFLQLNVFEDEIRIQPF